MSIDILIQTVPDDLHSLAIGAALMLHDARIYLSVGPNVPQSQSYSIFSDLPDAYSINSGQGEICNARTSLDIVWNRRSKMHDLQNLHPDDQAVAKDEFDKFIFGFWCIAFPNAKWINPWQTSYLADYKVSQLYWAQSIGFSISPTLYSNNPDDILRFIAHHGAENVIYKPHLGILWDEGGDPLGSSPVRVADFDYADPEAMQFCPGIYQRYIPKRNEIRITAMGSKLHGVKILTGGDPNATLDWRVDQHMNRVEAVDIPDDLAKKCMAYMRRAGLVFGCFDIIENLDGDFVFLEVNEMGQFLWIEMLNPELTYLDHFIDFLYETANKPRPPGEPLRLADIQASPEYAAMMDRIGASAAVTPS